MNGSVVTTGIFTRSMAIASFHGGEKKKRGRGVFFGGPVAEGRVMLCFVMKIEPGDELT